MFFLCFGWTDPLEIPTTPLFYDSKDHWLSECASLINLNNRGANREASVWFQLGSPLTVYWSLSNNLIAPIGLSAGCATSWVRRVCAMCMQVCVLIKVWGRLGKVEFSEAGWKIVSFSCLHFCVVSYLPLSSATAQVISKLPTELIYSSIELGPREKACTTISPL